MSILKKLAGQTAIYGMSSIVGRLLNYLLVPIYTRVLDETAEYGVVTEMYAYAGFFIVIFTYGMETAFFRFRGEAGNEKVFSTSIISIIISSIIFSSIIIFNASPLANFLTEDVDSSIAALDSGLYKNFIIWFALIFAFDAISAIPFAKLRAENRPKRFAAIKLGAIAINIILNLYFIVGAPWLVKNFNIVENIFVPAEARVSYIFIANLFASTATILFLLPDILKAKFSFDVKLWKRLMIYALPLVIVGLAGSVNEMLDRILLKFLLPFSYEENMSQLGIYGACYKLSILMTLFIQAYRYAAEPFYFSEAKKADAKKNYADAMRYFVIAGGLIFLGIMLYIDFVKYFIDERYHEGLAVVPILLMANLFLGIYYNLSVWYKLTDKTMMGAMISVGGAIITIVLNIVLIPTMGYLGSAWATLICFVVMVAISYALGQKHYPVNYNIPRLGAYLGGSLLLLWLSLQVKEFLPEIGYFILNLFFIGAFFLLVFKLENVKILKRRS